MTADRAADPIATARPDDLRSGLHGPFRLAVWMTGLVVFVILMGAMTTSTGSGLAFADWPLSDGGLMPERSYTTLPGFFEHFHRLPAGVAVAMAIWLAVWLRRVPQASVALRRSAMAGAVLIVAQAVIGGVGVLKGLPVLSSATHGTLAQVTLALFAVNAYALSSRCAATPRLAHPSAGAARTMAVVATAMLILQTVVGAIARHSGSPHALWTHVANALVVFLIVLVASGIAQGKLGAIPGVPQLARVLLGLLVVQIVLGFVALLVRTGKHPENVEQLWRAALISTHVLIGALLTVTQSLLTAHVFRGTAPAGGGGA
ncbi:MAG: heme A synthase [Planctomycetota bacterium]